MAAKTERCTECGGRLVESETSQATNRKTGRPARLCLSCASKLVLAE